MTQITSKEKALDFVDEFVAPCGAHCPGACNSLHATAIVLARELRLSDIRVMRVRDIEHEVREWKDTAADLARQIRKHGRAARPRWTTPLMRQQADAVDGGWVSRWNE